MGELVGISVIQVRDDSDQGQSNGEKRSSSLCSFMIEPVGFPEGLGVE